eukprot:365558-Chlamydomonas_euryale.AAC.3
MVKRKLADEIAELLNPAAAKGVCVCNCWRQRDGGGGGEGDGGGGGDRGGGGGGAVGEANFEGGWRKQSGRSRVGYADVRSAPRCGASHLVVWALTARAASAPQPWSLSGGPLALAPKQRLRLSPFRQHRAAHSPLSRNLRWDMSGLKHLRALRMEH